MDYFLNLPDYEGSHPEKFFKATLWSGEHITVGLNCLEPLQTQAVHAHLGADKFYFVLKGHGTFTVGDEEKLVEPGTLVLAPAGISHGVTNTGEERLSLLVGIAPPIN